ncbi:MAG: peptide chain release factor N(5)-glutamine methyltransferase [Ferruginibacter sp.]|nr:peptide chain release factor N(5)-glutamine methyltransferase [Cytophagales bacterium]
MVEAKRLFDALVKPLTPVYGADEARSIVFLLLSYALRLKKTDVLANKILAEAYGPAYFQPWIDRLVRHEPIQYVTGETEFYGRQFFVNPSVLIPRPETEELVAWILKEYALTQPDRILDIGTGSGCIAVTLAKEMQAAAVTAWDVSSEALTVARQNGEAHRASVRWQREDILKPTLPPDAQPYDLVVSNPPYVTRAEMARMQPNVREYEPHLALFVEDTRPLLFYERIVAYCQRGLGSRGRCYVEINEQFAAEVCGLFLANGFATAEAHPDLFDKPRFVRAIRA